MHSWPHAPARQAHGGGAVFVTAGTYLKAPLFRGRERLELLQAALFALAEERGLGLEAWAIFPNHYHLVARAEAGFDVSGFFKGYTGAPPSRSTAWTVRRGARCGTASATPR